MKLVYQPAPAGRLGDFLSENLASDAWTSFRAAVAFVKRSGTKYVAPSLAAFAQDRAVEVIAGIDHQGTSKEGLEDLLDAGGSLGRVIIFNNPDMSPPKTFHPKIYVGRAWMPLTKTGRRPGTLLFSINDPKSIFSRCRGNCARRLRCAWLMASLHKRC
jgi:hypothetical protein